MHTLTKKHLAKCQREAAAQMWTNLLGLDALVQSLLGSLLGEQELYNREYIKKIKCV